MTSADVSDLAKGIDIQVQTEHLEHGLGDKDKYAFAYHITIRNTGDTTVQLINRYWLITDSNGKKTEVRGAGVVGEQPVLEPGGEFSYTSGAMLETPVGTMQGFYEMQTPSGEMFQAPIEVFRLAVPNLVN